MKCPMCGKAEMKIKKEDFKMYGISLGSFKTEVCPKCGDKFYDEKVSEKINERAKKLGLWGLLYKTKVTQSGNALAVRVRRNVAEFTDLTRGEEVTIHPEGKHRIVIEC